MAKICCSVIMVLVCVTVAHSQESMADPLNLTGARAAGMGRTSTSSVNDATAIYWNPAAMSILDDGQAGLVFNYANSLFSISDPPPWPINNWEIVTNPLIDINFIGLAFPFSDGKDNTHLGIAVRKFNTIPPLQSEKIKLVNGEQFGWQFQTSGSIYLFTAAVSVNILEKLAIGGAFNFYSGVEELKYSTLSTSSDMQVLFKNKQKYSRTSFQGGIYYHYNAQWIFGINVQFPHVLDRQQNVETNGRLEVIDTQINFPVFMNLAATYVLNDDLNLSIDYFYRPWQNVDIKDGDLKYAFSDFSLNAVHLGSEYTFGSNPSLFALRLGYYYNPTVYRNDKGAQTSHHVITTGVGWNKGAISMNLGIEWIPFHYETGKLNTTIPGLPFEAPSTRFNSHLFQISLDFFVRIS